MRWAKESLVGTRGGGTLEVGAPSGWGYDILGSGLADREKMEVVLGGAVGGRAVVGGGDTLGDRRGGILGGDCWGTLGASGGAGAGGVGSCYWDGYFQF